MARIRQLGEDESFIKAVADAGVKPGAVVDSRDPGCRYQLVVDGTGAAKYFYQVRSNLSHRGKSAFQDAQLVHKAVTELSHAIRILLDRQLPTVGGHTPAGGALIRPGGRASTGPGSRPARPRGAS
jgi:hypothetical protein